MKKYFILSGLGLRDANRGTAALGYGSFSFLKEKGYLTPDHILLDIKSKGSPFRRSSYINDKTETINVAGVEYTKETKVVNWFFWNLYRCSGITIPFTKVRKIIKQLDFVAAINGGDGFSDIYNTETFKMRLTESLYAIKGNIPIIILPQTLGPFKKEGNYKLAKKILQKAEAVYVRDDRFINELEKMGVRYEITNDLSYYMKPEPWDIEVDKNNAIGINVSGLAYSNTFRTLSGQFDCYPDLIQKLVEHFQQLGKTIYLIPHSYRYGRPEESNDDIVACHSVYEKLEDKSNVVFVDKDLISPQVKYLISQMSFFIGTRMHANFAAIFTHVPLFGLAYSYKFQGAFEKNGIYNRTVMINNITPDMIDGIVAQIDEAYNEDVKHINNNSKLQ